MCMIRYVATSLAICLLSIAGGALAALSPATQTSITSDQAITLATNRITVQESGVKVENRLHTAVFTSAGLDFQPRRGPQWSWALSYIGSVDRALDRKTVDSVEPVRNHPDVIAYEREGVSERYVIKRGTIEQQFVIAKPLALGGKDLLVSGQVKTEGRLESNNTSGWLWRDADGVVSLGQVTVFDAEGQILLAKMQVAQDSTRIIVDGKALAEAVYPVTIDPEIGSDFRISDVNGLGSANSHAINPDVAYNPDDNEYLVVWWADEDGDLPTNDFEIYGQRIDAKTGLDVGANDFRISFMGDDGNPLFKAENPAVAYNSDNTEYLVVWQADHNEAALENDEVEIFSRRVDADGTLIGTTETAQTRISFMGGADGDSTRAAENPDVCYNKATQQYLVVWEGDDESLVDNEKEIFGQLVGADGAPISNDDIRISDMGDNGVPSFDAADPAVACNYTDKEYYVVWWGDDTTNQEFEIFAQRLDATGGPVGDNDKRISDMGNTDGETTFEARFPDVAYNAVENQYLVVWQGDDEIAALGNNEFEIFGQLIDAATGNEEDPNDFRISFMGGENGDTDLTAALPAVTYNAINNEYLVAWEGDDDELGNDDFEIFSRVVESDGSVDSSVSDLPLSEMSFGVVHSSANANAGPAVAFNTTDGTYVATWEGEHNADGMVDEEFEIFGQLVSAPATLRLTDSDSTVAEDVGNVSVTVQRLGDLEDEVSVAFDITGADVSDFTDLSTVVTFAAGSGGTQTVNVLTVSDDSVDENDETVTIALSSPTGGAELASAGTSVDVTITDNDDFTPTAEPGPEPEPQPEPITTSGGGGGGGCALSTTSRFDPVLPVLMLLAGVYFLRRKSTLH